MRNLILVVALAFIGAFAALTVAELVKNGVDVLTVASILIVGIMGFGIIGALRHPPGE